MSRTVLKLLTMVTCVVCYSTTMIFPQGYFQGKVTFQVTEEGNKSKISYLVKGSKFRIQPEEEQEMGMGAMIYDAETKMMTILMREQKMYMEMPLNMSEEMSNHETTSGEYFIKTGESKDIMGYSCDKFNYSDGNETGVAWMTKELGPFLFMNDPEGGSNTDSRWQQEIMEEGYFPMLVEQENSSGNMEKVFEVTDLQSMDLDDGLFLVPSGFSKFDMPGMMNRNK